MLGIHDFPLFMPFLALGLVLFTTGSLWCMLLVYGASWLTTRFRSRTSAGGVLKKLTGAVFIGLGIRLAFFQADYPVG